MSKKARVRFAPSPTGYLHLGNARMATLNCFLAKKINADFVLRIDDTDIGRVKPEYIDGVHEDLAWLGISWDEEFKQSDRLGIYNNFLAKLKEENLVYPCYETPEELDYKKKLQMAMKRPPIYDREMLSITPEQKAKFEAEGRKPHYRLKISHSDITWKDLIKGDVHFKGEHISDPVVMREDGSFLYLLTSVIDDIESDITHIIRGEDHVVNTAVQIQMFEYLNAPLPIFAHLPLITNNSGESFSKRDGALSLRKLRESGIHPMAINHYLFMLGLGERDKTYLSIDEIVKDFDLEKYNSASAKFDEEKLLETNLRILKELPFAEVQSMAKSYLSIDLPEHIWDVIKHNIHNFGEIKTWFEIMTSDTLITKLENPDLIKFAIVSVPNDDFSPEVWAVWLNAMKEKSELKGKALFHPLRLAFTGLEKGPSFEEIIMTIGKQRLINRLKLLVKSK